MFAATALQRSLAQDLLPACAHGCQTVQLDVRKGQGQRQCQNCPPCICPFCFLCLVGGDAAGLIKLVIWGGSSSDFGHDSKHYDLHLCHEQEADGNSQSAVGWGKVRSVRAAKSKPVNWPLDSLELDTKFCFLLLLVT